MRGWEVTNTDLRSPEVIALSGPPYSQGGTGKYGLESDQMLVHSANLLMKMKGEHLGTGAGVGVGRHRNTNIEIIAH